MAGKRQVPIRSRAVTEQFQFGPWKLTAVKSHILHSEGPERETFESQLKLPHVPEMIFADNILKLEHETGEGLSFVALDALRLVDPENDTIHVANAKEWREARSDCEHIDRIVNPFDWTFTTAYTGTLLSKDGKEMKVSPTEEKIDLEKLKKRDKINFYADIPLFEDELHDSGSSMLSVKIRVMPTNFLALMRLYMRVDGVIVRMYDTRLYHEAGWNYMIREFTCKENTFQELEAMNIPIPLVTEPNEVADQLTVKSCLREKLEVSNDTQNSADSTNDVAR